MNLSYLFISLLFFNFICAQKIPYSNQKTAILIVGNDAPDHATEHLNSLSAIFQTNGIFVYKFYYPDARWNDIQAKANSCSFFIYTGHGFGNGGLDGGFGGLYINEFVTAQDIVNGIDFKYKPLIIYLNACGSHGTSAGDPADIGIAEATKRISDTALPFFMVGSGAYFATSGMITGFLEAFLNGMTLQNSFTTKVGNWEDIVYQGTIKSQNELNENQLVFSSHGSGRSILYANGNVTITEKNPSKRYYGNAYVGPKNFVIDSISQESR